MITKICTGCSEEKPLDQYWKHPRGKHGTQARCIQCMTDEHRAWRAENPEIRRSINAEWARNNPDKIKDYQRKNQAKLSIKNKEWKRANPEKAALIYRRQNLKQKYGMTIEDFERMSQDQGGRCAICTKEGKLVVDHNHDTGQVRGLLCNDCNRNLIAQRNDPEIFYKAAEYLIRSREKVA